MNPDPSTPSRATNGIPAADRSGQTIGDFLLLRCLGEGGMGQVYLAEQVSLKRRVALKLLKNELASNEVSRKRFEAEAKAVARLTHANIVQVYAAGTETGVLYMALEYVDGRNLREFLHRKGPPPLPLALSILWQVASALQRAAELGIIHRDIKPENILLTRKHEVKVADFGLSRMIAEGQPAHHLTQTGVTLGTPLYMSPEQVEGKPLDHRTDIYSFGVTAYHLLTGQPPFEGENAFAVALQHVQKEPVPLEALRPDLPPALIALVQKMMAKKPGERYQTAGEILHDLKPLMEQVGGGSESMLALSLSMTEVPALSAAHLAGLGSTQDLQPPPSQWKNRLRVALLVVLSLLLAGGAGGLLAWSIRSPAADESIASPETATQLASLDALLGSYQRRERGNWDLIKETENPGRNRDDLRRGIQHRMELAILYLEQQPREVEKAEALFDRMRDSKVREYELLGTLGSAIVLAYRDEAELSLQRFQELRPLLPLPPELLLNTRFRKLLVDALYQNRRNCEAEGIRYPEELRRMEEGLRNILQRPAPPGT
jgi:serine/threonine-protein kinase